jgi:arsenite methyltransferase
VAGALTERDFVGKLEQADFGDLVVHQREPVSVDDLTLYPLFTDDVIEMMRTLISPDRQDAVATAIVVTAGLQYPRPRV